MKIPGAGYLLKRLAQYAEPVHEKYHLSYIRLYIDCICSTVLYKSTIKDYFLYRFYLRNSTGRHQFLTGIEMDKWYEAHNDKFMANELKDKEKSLIRFEQYMQRDWCGLEHHNTVSDYDEFVKKHEQCIAKPKDECGGHGIHLLSPKNVRGGYMLIAKMVAIS